MLWRFWRRRRPAPQIDQTGPATVYPHHGGAFLSEASARQGCDEESPPAPPVTYVERWWAALFIGLVLVAVAIGSLR